MKQRAVILLICSNAGSMRLLSLSVLFLLTLSGQAQPRCGSNRAVTRLSWSARSASTDVLYIPVVFHIVSRSSEQDISDEQIYSQLGVINEDFNRQNADTINTLEVFRADATAARIQFYIAEKDGAIGITRTATSHTPFHNDDLHRSTTGGIDAWDSEKYLNVWVADLAGGLTGYAASPGEPAFRDGVAIHYQFFGRHSSALAPYNLGRTLTHEIGHWLGLSHPWGVGGCESDDGIEDTPRQDGPVAGCDLKHTSCGVLSMTQNFMNTGEDACLNFFTNDQTFLMRETLTSLRPDVYTTEPIITSTEESFDSSRAWVYPNPVMQEPIAFVKIQSSCFQPFTLSLTDLRGRNVRQFDLKKYEREFAIDLNGLKNGVYIARIKTNRAVYSTRIYLNLN